MTLCFPAFVLDFMYIKKVVKSNSYSKKKFTYLHLVENIRTDNGPRQRLILSLGALDIAPEKYKELANCIEGMLNGQRTLFSPDNEIYHHASKAVKQIIERDGHTVLQAEALQSTATVPLQLEMVDISSLETNTVRSIGAEYVCHQVWQELAIDNCLQENGVSAEALPVIEALVLGRLIFSRQRTPHALLGRKSLCDLRNVNNATTLFPQFFLSRGTNALFCQGQSGSTSGQIRTRFVFPERESLLFRLDEYFFGRCRQ